MSYYRSPNANRGFRSSSTFRGGFRGRSSFRGRIGMRGSGGRDRDDYSERMGPKFSSFRDSPRRNWYGRDGPSHMMRDSDHHSRDKYSGRHDREDSGHHRYKESPSPYSSSRDNRRMSHDEADRKRMRSEVSSFPQESPHKTRGSYNSMDDHRGRFKPYSSDAPSSFRKMHSSRDFSTFKEPHPPTFMRRGLIRGSGTRGMSRIRRGTIGSRLGKPAPYIRSSRIGGISSRPSAITLHKLKMRRIMRMRNAANGVHYRSSSNERKKRKSRSRLSSPENDDKDNEASDDEEDNKTDKEEKKKESSKRSMKSSDSKTVKRIKTSKSTKEDSTYTRDSEMRNVSGSMHEEASRRNYITLKCVHCKIECLTFQKYTFHLQGYKHKMSMSRVLQSLKKKLGIMRMEQRNEQRALDDADTDGTRSSYCNLCKLNYKQPKYEHYMSDSHVNMVEFLQPRCKICRVKFQNPVAYEHHRSSLNHIKMKASLDRRGESKDENGEEKPDQFMVLDSVGSADENSASGDENLSEEIEMKENEDVVKEEPGIDIEKKKEDVMKLKRSELKKFRLLGLEYVKKIEVYFCNLCKVCMPFHSSRSQEEILDTHLRGRYHLNKYIPLKNKRIGLKKKAKADAAKKSDSKKSDADEKHEEKVKKSSKSKEKSKDEVEHDKSWTEGDKDSVGASADDDHDNKSSEDEEDFASGNRYDKFKHSDHDNTDKDKTTISQSSENSDKKDAKVVSDDSEK